MKRPRLDSTPIPRPFPKQGEQYITVSPGQWDALIQSSYESGWTLLEIESVNGIERIARAFKRRAP